MGKSENELKQCPFCQGTQGYYDKNIQAYQQHFYWNGEVLCVSEHMHVRGGKIKYCMDCNRDITKFLPE